MFSTSAVDFVILHIDCEKKDKLIKFNPSSVYVYWRSVAVTPQNNILKTGCLLNNPKYHHRAIFVVVNQQVKLSYMQSFLTLDNYTHTAFS